MDLPEYFLNRQSPPNSLGTMGDICDAQGLIICDTCERPWDNNIQNKSCILPAPSAAAIKYHVKRHVGHDHPGTWELLGVEGRTGILIHDGNTERDSLGCIIVGYGFAKIKGLPAVVNSRITITKLQTVWPDEFYLTVAWH